MTTAPTEQMVAQATRHTRLRWIGAPLLLSGAAALLWALFGVFTDGSGWTLAIAAFGTGMGLASFGANHDTAMALAFRVRAAGTEQLTDALREELGHEIERDRDAVARLRAAPRIALVLPLVAIGVQAWVFWRLMGSAA